MLPNSRNTLPPSSYFTSKQLSAHLLLPFLLQHCFHLTSVTPVLMILFPSFWLFLIFLCGYLWILPTCKCWTASHLNLESSFFIILSYQVISPAFLVLETTCEPRHCTFLSSAPFWAPDSHFQMLCDVATGIQGLSCRLQVKTLLISTSISNHVNYMSFNGQNSLDNWRFPWQVDG